MQRILIRDATRHIDQTINLYGRLLNIRVMRDFAFCILEDYTGIVQVVWNGEAPCRIGDVVQVTGVVRREERARIGFEIAAKNITVLATSNEEFPIDLSKKTLNLQLATLLDHRVLSLRHPHIQAIFKLYNLLLEGYAQAMRAEGCTEIKTPKLLGAASEGGANVFTVKYFDVSAYLAQSPQLYKQIMVGVFERVFEIGTVFRAEPHFTSRHMTEYVSIDAEIGFIENFRDITATLTRVIRYIFSHLGEYGQMYLEERDVTVPVVPDEIPHIKLAEIKKIIAEKYHYEIPTNTDIDPEGERWAGKYAQEELGSDFLFLTHYPWRDRPFYTMPDPKNPEETCSFDLLFRGTELATGSQRIHLYNDLITNMQKKGVQPNGLEFYLDTFKFAMPPHGGWGMGSERFIQLLLGLSNVKEATLFPRDVKRLSP